MDANEKPVGLLSVNPNGTIFMIIGDQKANFSNKEDLQGFLGFDIFNKVTIAEKEAQKEHFVNGFPVEYTQVYPVYDHPSGLPTFTKSKNSDTLYCAGYYCLHRDNGWARGYCSKLDTLSKYTYEGPFSTSVECRARLSTLKKKNK